MQLLLSWTNRRSDGKVQRPLALYIPQAVANNKKTDMEPATTVTYTKVVADRAAGIVVTKGVLYCVNKEGVARMRSN